MPQTRDCDFCGSEIEPGTGTMFVYANGTTVHYCSSKCEKNASLDREPRDQEWTAAGQAQGGEAAAVQAEAESEAATEPEELDEEVEEPAGEPGADAPDLQAAETPEKAEAAQDEDEDVAAGDETVDETEQGGEEEETEETEA